MKRLCFYIFIIASTLFLIGCTPIGIVYTHTKTPLDTNMSQTIATGKHAEGDIKHLSIPLGGSNTIDVMWSSNAIGDIAKKNGIETIYFADLEVRRILYIWNQYTVHVYGK